MLNLLLFTAGWIILAADRWLKYLAMEKFFYYNQENFFIVKPIFSFAFFANDKMAFSLPLSPTVVIPLSIFAILILLFFIIKGIKDRKGTLLIGLWLILVGALSNLFDRLAYGYVVDFLRLWPISYFNLADLLILAGAGWLIWAYWPVKRGRCRQK